MAEGYQPSRGGAGQGRSTEGGDDSLEGAARDEREYARGRLREGLGREPSEDEVSEWLRQQTEGY